MKYKLITALTACALLLSPLSGCTPKSEKYSIYGPVEQKEMIYDGEVNYEDAQILLEQNQSEYINKNHGEGAYIAYNPFCTLELDNARVLSGVAYYPIICDGAVVDAVVVIQAGDSMFCSNVADTTDWALINEKLAADPDKGWLFCTLGTVGLLISSENEIVTFTKGVTEKMTKFFDDSTDWYSYYDNEYSHITYNELTAGE